MKKYISLLFTLSILFGCDDFLGIIPKGELIPETVTHYDLLLNSNALLNGGDTYPTFMTDDAYFPPQSEFNTPGLNTLKMSTKNLYTFQKDVFGESETDNFWNKSYNRIYNYNTIIENVLDAQKGTEAEKRSVWAEALTGRAFEYLMLVNAYAKHYKPTTAKTDPAVPLLIKNKLEDDKLIRATVEEVYTQIEKDLNDAESFLPDNPKSNAFRASKKAAYGIYARMYLYKGDYEKAFTYANKLLQTNKFLLDLKPYEVVDPLLLEGRIRVPDGIKNEENIFLKYANIPNGLSLHIFASDDLIQLYNQENDKRFLLYFSNKYMQNPLSGYIYMPFLFTNIAITTPEIYLIAAECEARIGNKDKAMELVNQLRDKRILANTPLSANSNDDALIKVLEERRREFAMVGITRFIDLRRLNIEPRFAKTVVHASDNIEYKLEPNSPLYVLPIPLKVLQFNPGMTQNER